MKWGWICTVISVCLIQVQTAPRNRRWIPERYSDDDYGMDNGYVPSGPSYDVPGSHNSLNQNYMSYYWPDYYNNRRDSSDDYSGLMYRANDNPQHMMSDPVQQLYDVQSYSYAQTMPSYHPQMNPGHGYSVGGRAHGESHTQSSSSEPHGRALIKVATATGTAGAQPQAAHSSQAVNTEHEQQLIFLQPHSFSTATHPTSSANANVVQFVMEHDQSSNLHSSPASHFTAATMTAMQPQHFAMFNNENTEMMPVFFLNSHAEHNTAAISEISSSSDGHPQSVVMMKSISPFASSTATSHAHNSQPQFFMMPTNGHQVFMMAPSTSASKNFLSTANNDHVVFVMANHEEKSTDDNEKVVVVHQSNHDSNSKTSSTSHHKPTHTKANSKTQAVKTVLVDTHNSKTKTKPKKSQIQVVTKDEKIESESASDKVVEVEETIVNVENEGSGMTGLGEDETGTDVEETDTAIVEAETIVQEQEDRDVVSNDEIVTEIEEVLTNNAEETAQETTLEKDQVVEEQAEAETISVVEARAMEPASPPKYAYSEPVLSSPVDMVYPGVLVPSKPYSYYQPQYPAPSYVQPVPYYGTPSLLPAPQQYPSPYLSYGQIMQPNKYVSSSPTVPTAYYGTYPAQNINIPGYSSSYNSQPRQSRHVLVSQSAPARNAYAAQQAPVFG